jgi:hypothetical protein
MSQLTLSQARVIDPVLTNIAQGYSQLGFVGGALFPTVPVSMRAGNVITFGREDFMLYNTQRAPGEATRRVQFGYAGNPFALVDYSLEGALPIENLQEGLAGTNGWSIDGASLAIRKTLSIMGLRLEYAQAVLATTAANYAAGNKNVALAGTSLWSDLTTGVSDPIANIETGKEAVRAATGRRPNTVVMGALVATKLRQHPKIVDRMKYTGRDIATNEILASLFGVDRVLVGDAVYSNDAGTAFTDVWGKAVVLAYTETAALADMGAPTYGYTYNLGGYPIAEQPYFDRNAKTWFFPVTRAEAPVIAGATAGYLISPAVA